MTTRRRMSYGFWFGLLLTALFIAINASANKLLHIPLLPFVLFDWLTMRLPGTLVTWGLDTMIALVRALHIGPTYSVAKTAEQLLGLLVFMLLGGVLGLWFGGWVKKWALLVPLLPTLALILWFDNPRGWLPLSVGWFILTWGAWLYLLQRYLSQLDGLQDDFSATSGTLMTRRIFLMNTSLQLLGIAVGLGAARYALNSVIIENARAGKAFAQKTVKSLFPPRPTPDTFTLAEGTRAEITPVGEFYTIHKNLVPPNVNADEWRLKIIGAVGQELTFTYDEILAMEAVEFHATLMCISNEVGGDLIGTTLWRGVPLAALLQQAGVKDSVQEIKFHSADGYYETLPLAFALLSDTVLCYGMEGQSLTVPHGFPLRLYTPGRYGMKNPKWIHTIEALPHTEDGYWTERSWSKNAFINATTIIDTPRLDPQNGILSIGGIAFSGAEGISKVEVRVDQGAWLPAEFRTPLSPLTWVQWRAEIPFSEGKHDITARCTDSQGKLQTATRRGSRPDGATGYHNKRL